MKEGWSRYWLISQVMQQSLPLMGLLQLNPGFQSLMGINVSRFQFKTLELGLNKKIKTNYSKCAQWLNLVRWLTKTELEWDYLSPTVQLKNLAVKKVMKFFWSQNLEWGPLSLLLLKNKKFREFN